MERQTILERLGWRFIRIRGSEYYRHPEKTMERVIRELNNYGIYPEHVTNTAYEENSSDLLSCVKIRAAQIIDEWHKKEVDADLLNEFFKKMPIGTVSPDNEISLICFADYRECNSRVQRRQV